MPQLTTTLKEMQEFLSSKKQITVLAEMSGVSTRTVYDAFDAPDFDALSGKQLTVVLNAIELIDRIKSLPQAANEVLNK